MAFNLPTQAEELHAKIFANLSTREAIKLLHKRDLPRLTPEQRVVVKYCIPPLLNGRYLDTVEIFVYGSSDEEKSATVNSLFDNQNLCKSSAAKQVTTYRYLHKEVEIGVKFKAFLDLVVAPEEPDTEANNLGLTYAYRQSQLKQHRCDAQTLNCTSIREKVFPNVVLVVYTARDISDTNIVNTIQRLNLLEVVDKEKPNLVIVVTNARLLGCDKETFVSKLKSLQQNIQQHTYEILGIKNVPVIPVENVAKDATFKKVGDFIELPNGELSQKNLFEAIVRCLDHNSDILGRLIFSRAFGNLKDAQKTDLKVEIFDEAKINQMNIPTSSKGIPSSAPTHSNTNEQCVASGSIYSKNCRLPSQADKQSIFFQIHCIGHAYCPVTEETKPAIPLCFSKGTRDFDLGNSKFVLPEDVEVYLKREDRIDMRSFLKKDEYEEHMKNKYGFDVDIPLVVSGSSQGRWITQATSTETSCLVTMVLERQIGVFRLSNIPSLPKNPSFAKELKALPKEYSDKTKPHFQAFFARWGSHLISEMPVGGSVQLNGTVQQTNLTREQLQNLNAKITGALKVVVSAGTQVDLEQQREELHTIGYSNVGMKTTGGKQPSFLDWSTLSSEEVQEWFSTVPANPTELNTSLELYPYYSLLEFSSRYIALKDATCAYLSNTLSERISKVEDAVRGKIAADSVSGVKQTISNNRCFPLGSCCCIRK